MDLDNLRHALPTNLSTSTSVSNMVYTFKNPYPQHFSILYHIVEYMIENPQSGKAWKKLIMSCKYFYSKKPVFSVSTLDVLCDVKCRADNENFDATSPFPKLWVFDKLETKDGEFVALKPLMPKIAKFDLRVLQIDDETLTWKDYQKLTSSDTIEQLFFKSIIIKNANGTMVTFDKILQNLPHLKAIEIICSPGSFNLEVPDTVRKMVDLLFGFLELQSFTLRWLNENFDFPIFKTFLLKNRSIDISFDFGEQVSDAYKEMVNNVLEEIRKNPALKIPDIKFGWFSAT